MEDKEIKILGQPTGYYVSGNGDIFKYKDGSKISLLNPAKYKSDYPSVSLTIEFYSIRLSVHRIVAVEFLPNPKNKPDVNHKNGNPADNRVDNLEWCTTSENIRHSSVVRKIKKQNPNATYSISIEDLYQYEHGDGSKCNDIKTACYTCKLEFDKWKQLQQT